jgi:hypothetical protein
VQRLDAFLADAVRAEVFREEGPDLADVVALAGDRRQRGARVGPDVRPVELAQVGGDEAVFGLGDDRGDRLIDAVGVFAVAAGLADPGEGDQREAPAVRGVIVGIGSSIRCDRGAWPSGARRTGPSGTGATTPVAVVP